jgi:glycosyltransferase involved in cell wall biosynthesis
VLIPAFDEAGTVADVVQVARAAALGPVLVVDDGSSDATSEKALEAGAVVLRLLQNQGKGGAVWAGAEALQTEVVVLIDADLLGLTPKHLRDLAQPVLEDKADMTRGVFVGGRWQTTAAQKLTPQLNGQRAILREKLLSLPDFRASRYGIEIIITQAAKRLGWRCQDVALQDVSQVMKEEKRGFWAGFKYRLGMYRDLIKAIFNRPSA